MIITNYKYNSNVCGHYFGGETRQNWCINPYTMRGYYGKAQIDLNIEQIKRDSFNTGTCVPYSIVIGDKGSLLSSTTNVYGLSSVTLSSLSKGVSVSTSIEGYGGIEGNLSLIIQLASTLISSCTVSAALVGKLEMAASIAASGNITSSLKLIAYCVSEITSESNVEATLRGTSSMSSEISSTSELSPEGLASAVWNTLAASFNTPGTMGAKLNSASAAGDPWGAILPGSYADGEAGKILAQIQTLVDELHKLQGLDADSPMSVTPTSRTAGGISLEITGDGENETIVTRNA